jgi:hypothetical protein
MLDGALPAGTGDPHHTNQFYKSIQAFADASARLCEEGKFKELEQFLTVAWKLFKDGNETVKNGIVNVYLFTLSRVMDMQVGVKKNIEPLMPKELRLEYARLHYISGL